MIPPAMQCGVGRDLFGLEPPGRRVQSPASGDTDAPAVSSRSGAVSVLQAAWEFDPRRAIGRCLLVFDGQGSEANRKGRGGGGGADATGALPTADRSGVSGGPDPVEIVGMEAASGFEPLNRGFADLRLGHLATPPGPDRYV
jgi:hypothetical protein